jgi:hypothetical protein
VLSPDWFRGNAPAYTQNGEKTGRFKSGAAASGFEDNGGMGNTGKAPPLEKKGTDPKEGGSLCVQCGARFECAMNGPAPCWCAAYPRVLPVPEGNAGCYCPACLAELTASQHTKIGAPPS